MLELPDWFRFGTSIELTWRISKGAERPSRATRLRVTSQRIVTRAYEILSSDGARRLQERRAPLDRRSPRGVDSRDGTPRPILPDVAFARFWGSPNSPRSSLDVGIRMNQTSDGRTVLRGFTRIRLCQNLSSESPPSTNQGIPVLGIFQPCEGRGSWRDVGFSSCLIRATARTRSTLGAGMCCILATFNSVPGSRYLGRAGTGRPVPKRCRASS